MGLTGWWNSKNVQEIHLLNNSVTYYLRHDISVASHLV